MNRLFIILICVFFLTDILHSQDFKFVWQLQPSFFDPYKVTVIQRGLIRQIQIKKTFASDSIIKKITNIDCDSLFFILNDLEFTTKGSTTSKVIRMYCDTKHISDTNRLVLNNDTIRKGLLRRMGYFYDTDSNRYYQESHFYNTWTDGNTYEGEFTTLHDIKKFSIYCAMISKNEYELNLFIYRLIKRYDRKNDYHILRQIIIGDKPREKK